MAANLEVTYIHPLDEQLTFDVHYRYNTQDAADFYSDLFFRAGEQNYMARDKEMSTFQDHTIGMGVSYEFRPEQWQFVDHGSLNLEFDYLRFDYDNFRDLTASGSFTPGEEPLYSFTATVIKAYVSIWY